MFCGGNSNCLKQTGPTWMEPGPSEQQSYGKESRHRWVATHKAGNDKVSTGGLTFQLLQSKTVAFCLYVKTGWSFTKLQQ